MRYDGATGAKTSPVLIDDQATGHQLFPDIAVSGGVLHAIWWDSRNDPTLFAGTSGRQRRGRQHRSRRSTSTARSRPAFGASWTGKTRISTVTSNPNYEQFADRTVPFAGDYLWVTANGAKTFATWTDWRDTVAGYRSREVTEDEDAGSADVTQCRTFSATTGWSGDTCPHAGGLDQNIYGATAP